MPLLRKGILIPVKGIDFSQPATFIDERSGFPTNMRYYKSELRKRPGKTIVGEVILDATQIMGLAKLEMSTLKYVVRVSKAKLQKYNTSTLAWEAIAVADFTGGDDDFFSFANITESELLIITNGFDRIRKWPGSGNNALLLGDPPLAKFCCYLSPYLLLAHVDDGISINPWKVQWCDTDNPEEWITGNAGEAMLSDEPSPIMNIAKLNEYVAVYKKDSLWLGHKVDPPDIFKFDCMKTGVGLAASRAFADAEGQHYFMGLNDFYVWNGIRVEPIGGPVRDEVFRIINRVKINRCFAISIQELQEVWFFVVAAGDDWPKHIYKYNYRLGFWYYDTCNELTAAVKWEKIKTQSWDDDPGPWDAAGDAWNSAISVQDWEEILFGDKAGYNYKLDYNTLDDNEVAVNAFFCTKDFTGDQLEFNKRWLQLDIWARGVGKLWVDYSIDEGDNWINIPYTSSQTYINLVGTYTKTEMFLDAWSDKIRFRFRNNVSGETFFIRNFYPYYTVKEEIRSSR